MFIVDIQGLSGTAALLVAPCLHFCLLVMLFLVSAQSPNNTEFFQLIFGNHNYGISKTTRGIPQV